MAAAFGVRALGTALVVISDSRDLRYERIVQACFPSLPEYRSGLPKRSQAPALQRLRRFDSNAGILSRRLPCRNEHWSSGTGGNRTVACRLVLPPDATKLTHGIEIAFLSITNSRLPGASR